MNKIGSGALALFVTTSVGLVFACGSSTSGTCDETATCTPSGGDGGGSDVAVPEGCDANADPKDAPKCVVNDFGVFVDGTNGSDANPGTRESPMKTINGALAKTNGKPRVYICEGTYEEHVKLTTATSLYGGFACGSWTPSGQKAKVAPKDEGYALEMSGVGSAITVSGLEFVAKGGSAQVPSSIAIFAVNVADAKFRALKAEAGPGVKGTAPTQTPVAGTPTPLNLIGNVGGSVNGGDEKVCTCSTGGSSKGGRGGSMGASNIDGAAGETPQAVPTPAQATGAGGTRATCEASGTGVGARGSDAPAAANAASPAVGTVAAIGWLAGDGLAGENGKPGQGGGGGGSYNADMSGVQNGGGGGGGCGGCGGGGGGGGKAGGASIAVLAFQSKLSVEASALVSGDAGDGGNGLDGAAGQTGGVKGFPGNGACTGGNGGTGGKGGAGSGGSGGVSAGVVHKGAKPTTTDTTITTGAKGSKGLGGASNDGADGVKADVLEIP